MARVSAMLQEPLTQLGQGAPNWGQTREYWGWVRRSFRETAGKFARLEARGQGWEAVQDLSEPSPTRSLSYPPRKEDSKPKMQSTVILGIFSGRVPRASIVASRASYPRVDLRSTRDTHFPEGDPGKGGEAFLRESALHAADRWVALNAPPWRVGWEKKLPPGPTALNTQSSYASLSRFPPVPGEAQS